MPFYQKRGEIPRKRHTAFRKQDGSLHYEELMSRAGFSGVYSNLYHLTMPTRVKAIGGFREIAVEPAALLSHTHRHIKTFELESRGDLISSRKILFFNSDLQIIKAHPSEDQKSFYRNGHFDELWYVQQGEGILETQLGSLEFRPGDYVIIPRGVIYRTQFFRKTDKNPSLLIIESRGPICTPKKYRNTFGQLLEHSPYCERDLRTPMLQPPRFEQGEFSVWSRLEHGMQEFIYDHHPFDVVGWDGYHYPWALSITDFEPIVGRIHQPPPVHQTFEGDGFVVCSFVSRPFDFHPEAIPAPYPHSNVDSDEILFYSEGNFMSRKEVFPESITYHPMGLAHGPQPGKYEESIGKKFTEERAVMIDTFKPLHLAVDAKKVEDSNYVTSWIG